MDRIATLRAWLADKPEDRFATYSLALELEKAGDLAAAEATLIALLAAHPGSGAGHFRLGQLLVTAGRDGDARAAWSAGLAALASDPSPAAARSRSEISAALAALEDEGGEGP